MDMKLKYMSHIQQSREIVCIFEQLLKIYVSAILKRKTNL